MPQNHKELKVYQEAFELAEAVYRVTANFPKEEVYGLSSQLKRAASSIGANIAEGCGRNTPKDFANFLHIAMGSVKECEHFLDLAQSLNYSSTEDHQKLSERLDKIGKMLANFIKKVKE